MFQIVNPNHQKIIPTNPGLTCNFVHEGRIAPPVLTQVNSVEIHICHRVHSLKFQEKAFPCIFAINQQVLRIDPGSPVVFDSCLSILCIPGMWQINGFTDRIPVYRTPFKNPVIVDIDNRPCLTGQAQADHYQHQPKEQLTREFFHLFFSLVGQL